MRISSDRIDDLTRAEREARIESIYGRKPLSPDELMMIVNEAVAAGQGLSLVRAGDVMVDLLTDHQDRILIWKFIGVPKPPPPEFLARLKWAFRNASILGLTHRGYRPEWLAQFMAREAIRPPQVVESFICDSLLAEGHLHDLIGRFRVALVGRSAPAAAAKLSEQGLQVATHVDLEAWDHLPAASGALRGNLHAWDVALIGAGESGRILAVELATQAGKVALDIGHAMDGLAHPELWSLANRRVIFRRMYRRQSKN